MIKNIPVELKDALANDKLVLFIGSGFSSKLGLSTWPQLAKKAINEFSSARKEIKGLQILLDKNVINEIIAFDVLKNINKAKIQKIIKSDINIRIQKKQLINHLKLWKITERIITTNYDKALQMALIDNSIEVVANTQHYEISRTLSMDKWLYHIHGRIDDIDNCVIFSEDYHKFYNNLNPAIAQLKNIVTNNVVLFIGFSMNDQFVAELFEKLNILFEGNNSNKHFVLMKKSHQLNHNYLNKIGYDKHSEIDNYLDLLIKVKSKLRQSPIPVKRYARRRCRTFMPGSAGFNKYMIELRYKSFTDTELKSVKKKLDKLECYERILSLSAYYENLGNVEKMREILESTNLFGDEENTRLLFLALAFEKLDFIKSALEILDKIITNPMVDEEIRMCASFNRSICCEKTDRLGEVYFEHFIKINNTLRFTKERISDKAICNHLIFCSKEDEKFMYDLEFNESVIYEKDNLPYPDSKTLINYLIYQKDKIDDTKFYELKKACDGLTITSKIASICTIFKMLKQESVVRLKDEILNEVNNLHELSKSEATLKYVEDLRNFIDE